METKNHAADLGVRGVHSPQRRTPLCDGHPGCIVPKPIFPSLRAAHRLEDSGRLAPIAVPPGVDLRVFRRQVGPVINYELTQLSSPRILENLREPG